MEAKRRIYRGRIAWHDCEWLEKQGIKVEWLTIYRFIPYGFLQNGSRITTTYKICGYDGEPLEEYRDCQFTKDRDNKFYLQSYK